MSGSDGEVKQWDINGHQIAPTFDGYYAAFFWVVLSLLCTMGQLLRFEALTPEHLWLNIMWPLMASVSAVFPLMVSSLQLLMMTQSISGTSPAQRLNLLRPSLVILVPLDPLKFPPLPPLSQDQMTEISSSGRLVPHQQLQL